MFADDIALVGELVAKYGPAQSPIVDVGGLERPCVAQYQITIDAMARLREDYAGDDIFLPGVHEAQRARYLDIERPLSFLGEYRIENPSAGGVPIELLHKKYGLPESNYCTEPSIGTAILLSVLEHVDDPFFAIEQLRLAMAPGGLVIVSVPFTFPYHPDCGQDNFRFTPSGLRAVFRGQDANDSQRDWDILECDWRLDIPAEAGVLDIKTGRAQIIKSCYLAARAVG